MTRKITIAALLAFLAATVTYIVVTIRHNARIARAEGAAVEACAACGLTAEDVEIAIIAVDGAGWPRSSIEAHLDELLEGRGRPAECRACVDSIVTAGVVVVRE